MNEFGKIEINTKCFIQAAEELLRADETAMALDLLEMLPGFYRDYPPQEILEMKDNILKRIATPLAYRTNPDDNFVSLDVGKPGNEYQTLRAGLICLEVKLLNEKKLTPIVVDYGPGEYWLPIMLHNKGYQFKYLPLGLNGTAESRAKEILQIHETTDVTSDEAKNSPMLFIACEIIEHLWFEREIKVEMLKLGRKADVCHFSTPKYTYDIKKTNWEIALLGHLRTYTPKEFENKIVKMFWEYQSIMYTHQILHMRSTLSNSPFLFLNEKEYVLKFMQPDL